MARLFISCNHRDHNQPIARPVVALLLAGLEIKPEDIRATSVQGHKLAVGSPSAASLQADLEGAEGVLGLLGPETAESDYVLFELGAAWGLDKPTFPLRVQGATYEQVPEVLRERSSLSLEDESQCRQLVEDLARVCDIPRRRKRRGAQTFADVTAEVRKLAKAAAKRSS